MNGAGDPAGGTPSGMAGGMAGGPGPETAGVIAPPPLLFAGTLAAGLLLDRALWRTQSGLPAVPRDAVAVLLMALALFVALGATRKFRAAGTPVPPWEPTTAIVTTGVYAYTRNPIYLGMALLYAGIALLADSVLTLALLAPLLLVVRHGVIAREERYLERRFGAPYLAYKAAVRRWL